MAPDYSEFNSATISTTKISQHVHRDGSIHIEMDCILPSGMEGVAAMIRQRFDSMIKTLPGVTLVSEDTWVGAEADAHDIPAQLWHEQVKCKRDPSREN